MSVVSLEKVTEEGLPAALRWLAEAIDDGLAPPDWMYPDQFSWYVGGDSELDARARMRDLRRSMPRAVWAKDPDTLYYKLKAQIFGVEFKILADRNSVCKKVVEGTESVEVPDPDYVAPPVPMVTVEKDVVKWVCDE